MKIRNAHLARHISLTPASPARSLRWVCERRENKQPFSGLPLIADTVETVGCCPGLIFTQPKRGVNERGIKFWPRSREICGLMSADRNVRAPAWIKFVLLSVLFL